MGREERKLKKHLQQREITERRKLAQKKQNEPVGSSDPSTNSPTGFVVEASANSCIVRCEGHDLRCKALNVSVGDRVQFSREFRRVERVLPRTTVLSRPDPHNPRIERVIAANIDVVVNVVSVGSPPLRPGLIDRYLIAIERSGAEPLICVNKTDLSTDLRLIQPYQEAGVKVVFCSAATGDGLDELRAAIAGKICVFTGHSGVGKSSLLNALDPLSGAATGDVSEGNSKGRHTTTSSRLYELPNGAVIIDTPGIREFGLWDVTPEGIRLAFREFGEHAENCAFRDCTHTHEPKCGVKQALESGAISRARYDSYCRITGGGVDEDQPLPCDDI